MPIYRHSLKKQTRALAMIYGKKKKVPPIVEDQPTTNYGIKLCLQLWKTNPPQIMALSFVSNCGRPTTMGMDPNKSPPPDPCQNGRRKTHKPLAGFHASEHRTKLHLLLWNDFCHHVSCILVCVNLLQLESFLFCSITNPVISDFNMFCSRVICGILAQVYCTLTVAIFIPHTHLVAYPVL